MRPSDWWAASSSTPQQEREVRDAPAAANRGKPTTKKGSAREDENRDELSPAKMRHNGAGRVTAQRENDQKNKKIEKLEKRKREQQEATTNGRSEPSTSQPGKVAESHKPTRRGRSSNDEAELRALNEAWAKAQDVSKRSTRRPVHEIAEKLVVEPLAKAKGKRVKRAAKDSQPSPISTPVIEKDVSKKRQQRPAKDSRDGNGTESSTMGTAPKKKRKRNSNIPEPVYGVPYGIEEEERGRKRTRRSDVYQMERDVAASTASQEDRDPNSQRQADVVIEIEAAASRTQKVRSAQKKSTKASKSEKSSAKEGSQGSKITSQTSHHSLDQRIASKKGHSQIRQSKSKRERVQAPEPDNRPAKRQRVEKPPREQAPEEESEVPYQHLAAVTRNISRQTIEAKWDQLPSNCIELISQLLQDIQRPVVVRLPDERKRTQASTALQMVSRKLISKITKGLPFPQGTRSHREDDFDFEKILDHNRLLETQLTPALHANELLEAELSKEITRLEAEQANLAELEANARTEGILRNQTGRKLHSLLQLDDALLDLEEFRGDIGLDASAAPCSLSLNVNNP